MVLAVSTAVWTGAAVLQGVAAYSDSLRRGTPAELGAVLWQNGILLLPWVPFTAVLFFVLSDRHDRRAGLWPVVLAVTAGVVVFYLPQVGYQIVMSLVLSGRSATEFVVQLRQWPASYWLIDFTLYLLACSVVYAVVALRASHEDQQRRQRLDAENLTLRLEIERQRLQSLQAQLEPHFLFNALNAISGLVRGGNATLALTALQQLSALLRYALAASSRTWVTVGDELAFVRDYITLQQLRFGDRLRLVVAGDDAPARAAECPALLLQPLVENAIRHDLECHDQPGDITLTLSVSGDRMRIEVANTVRPNAPGNPGLGLGLPSTRHRVALLYGAQAHVTAGKDGDRFVVSVDIPLQAPEEAPA